MEPTHNSGPRFASQITRLAEGQIALRACKSAIMTRLATESVRCLSSLGPTNKIEFFSGEATHESSEISKTIQWHRLSDMPCTIKKPLARAYHSTIRDGYLHRLCRRTQKVFVLVARQLAGKDRRCPKPRHPNILAENITARNLLMAFM